MVGLVCSGYSNILTTLEMVNHGTLGAISYTLNIDSPPLITMLQRGVE